MTLATQNRQMYPAQFHFSLAARKCFVKHSCTNLHAIRSPSLKQIKSASCSVTLYKVLKFFCSGGEKQGFTVSVILRKHPLNCGVLAQYLKQNWIVSISRFIVHSRISNWRCMRVAYFFYCLMDPLLTLNSPDEKRWKRSTTELSILEIVCG